MEKKEKKEISISIWDRLGAAIQEGDKSKAIALFKETKEEFDKFRASYLDFPNFTLTALAEKCGEEAVHEVLRKIAEETIWVHFGKEFPRWSAEERIRRRAWAWTRSHGVGIDIEEDDEKFIVRIPCDTGGVILGKKECGRVKEPHPWSAGERDIGYYCTHCLIAFEEMAIERYGHPWWITFPPKKAGERCVQYHYKDITQTPEKYYQRTGKSKPK
jgi:hypothetical protein